MTKKLVPHKMVISFETNGTFKDGVILYRIMVDGVLKKGYNSLAIKNIGFSKPQFNEILKKIKDHVKQTEGAE